MKRQLLFGSIVGVLLVIVHQSIDFINIPALQHYQLPRFIFLAVFGILAWSIVGVFKKIFAPIIILVVGIGLVNLAFHVFEVELNYYVFQDERNEIIDQLLAGEIQKEDPTHSGFAFYYTPPEYTLANRDSFIDARMYSEEKHFIFFQTATPRFLDFIGLTEGFVYSSTGTYPTMSELDTSYTYRKINDHWYFVSSDSKRFKNSCYIICEPPETAY
ncbi:hypothetical protein GPDM_07665 [Planococcus donghaensis MPA1U2]|uniref:Uncharacterized protein n=1 Tax=Planococcus donghaensis MPA1U2 TaxID=933115 RepID=E7RGD5_9BACL|nr:hypothetical protein [Planococcus donghaensis]EGA89910.1 hypothetical protein GPDM_07665 [Planococcus donghaensis MPA1U2]